MYRCKWFSIKLVTGRCQNDSVLAARCTCKALLRSAAAALEHLTARTLSTGGASKPDARAITRILNASALSYRADRRLEPSQVVADHCERLFWWTPQLPPTRRRRPCRQRFGSHAPSVGTAEPASRTSARNGAWHHGSCPFRGRTADAARGRGGRISIAKPAVSLERSREGFS